MELSTKYDEIQSQIESEEADFALASDRVQTEDDLCNIACNLLHLLEQAEHMKMCIRDRFINVRASFYWWLISVYNQSTTKK